jgi:DNA-binding MarR family transcriptional regulator
VKEIYAGEMLKQINDELGKRANKALKADDLTVSQAGVIVKLGEDPKRGLSIKDLSSTSCVSQPTMTGIVDRLEKKGIVYSTRDAGDSRIRLVHLDKKGMQCMKNAKANMLETEQSFLKGLTAEERKQLITLLGKVKDNLTK